MQRLWLRCVFALDRARFALLRLRWGRALQIEGSVSPNLRLLRLRIEPGGCLALGSGVATERSRENHVWIQAGGRLELGRRTWLCTEAGPNRITIGAGARVAIGEDSLLNGAMLRAKASIEIGRDARIGFGARILDADLHDLDAQTPERIEPVRIGDRVWIGADALVLRGVEIGDDTVVGAGSIVTRSLPPRVLALGAPARPIRPLAPRTDCR